MPGTGGRRTCVGATAGLLFPDDAMDPAIQQFAHHCRHRQQKHCGSTKRRDTVDNISVEEGHSDSDLSDSERHSVLPSGGVPPKLELRPEVIQTRNCPSPGIRPKEQRLTRYDFPDFLPPPFNSWTVGQLSVFYNTEHRGAARHRPVSSLERYLERLLELEWQQFQTIQEEGGIPTCQRTPHTFLSCLSSPKCFLQCQRAFPLTFLSSLASHSAKLQYCPCVQLQIHNTSRCVVSCRSTDNHQPLGPLLGNRSTMFFPKRSYSEIRVHVENSSPFRPPRLSSPVRTNNSHMRRMEALGNIRNPIQVAKHKPARYPSTSRERRDHEVACNRTGRIRRSVSEQRKSGAEIQTALERPIRGSECRKKGDTRQKAVPKEQEIKPNAVNAIKDNLPGPSILQKTD
ncbi:protein FAM217B-like isoform X1 [Hippocampus zosterae]|uniref:protein FAM217B-like isoform X1 n=1 Tax=Hippocampus zosterae TaxID=109293 RepID=UPI00223CDA9C|nr:protein FAM217B-like isoform X1 [Hippocampus zosterae]